MRWKHTPNQTTDPANSLLAPGSWFLVPGSAFGSPFGWFFLKKNPKKIRKKLEKNRKKTLQKDDSLKGRKEPP
jgi:hypothetical protein